MDGKRWMVILMAMVVVSVGLAVLLRGYIGPARKTLEAETRRKGEEWSKKYVVEPATRAVEESPWWEEPISAPAVKEPEEKGEFCECVVGMAVAEGSVDTCPRCGKKVRK